MITGKKDPHKPSIFKIYYIFFLFLIYHKIENDDELTDEELNELLQLEARQFFSKLIKDEEEKKKFVKWLFNLADVDKSNTINTEELTLIIDALAHDGINGNNLISEKAHVIIYISTFICLISIHNYIRLINLLLLHKKLWKSMIEVSYIFVFFIELIFIYFV